MESYLVTKLLVFEIDAFELLAVFSVIMVRIASIGRKQFYIQLLDFKSDWNGRFPALSKIEWSKRWVKVRFRILVQCLGHLNTLTSEGCSETKPPKH